MLIGLGHGCVHHHAFGWRDADDGAPPESLSRLAEEDVGEAVADSGFFLGFGDADVDRGEALEPHGAFAAVVTAEEGDAGEVEALEFFVDGGG